jgi:hypothetical protein
MDFLIPDNEVRDFLYLPENFDETLIDQEIAFISNVFPYISEDIFLEIKNSTDPGYEEIYQLLNKAVIRYAFILSIPSIKVHISNFGIHEFNDDDIKIASWWNVRDLGLSYLKAADKYFSEALTKASKIAELKTKIGILKNANDVISTPAELNSVFSINFSPEIYSLLVDFLNEGVELFLKPKLESCNISNLINNKIIGPLIKRAIAFYAFYNASMLPKFVFLKDSIVIQYEELPWQKSVLLTPEQKIQTGYHFLKLAEKSIENILIYLDSNKSQFPCYTTENKAFRETIKKKSGLYI